MPEETPEKNKEPTLEEKITPLVRKLLNNNIVDIITAKTMIETLPPEIPPESFYFQLYNTLIRLEGVYSTKSLGPNHEQEKQNAKSKCKSYFPD